MKFLYKARDKHPTVVKAIAFAESLTAKQAFWTDLANLPSFTQTSDAAKFTPEAIAKALQACTHEVEVHHYTSKDPNSTTTAYVSSGHAFHIHLNTRKLGRKEDSHTGTLVHEFVHVVDCFCDTLGKNKAWEFGHSKEASAERPRSAPYRIGNLAIRHWRIANGLTVSAALEDMEDYLSEEDFECDFGDVAPELAGEED